MSSLSIVYAQNANERLVTGKLLDAQTKDPLIGATVTVKGTNRAAAAGLDGSFKIRVPESANTLVVTYIGYVAKEVAISGSSLGEITLDPTTAAIKEVTVTTNASLAIDRQTPIAVSSVGAKYIEEKGAGAEFPELLKSTPGVTVSRAGGGYGDSRIAIRGFNSNNLALLINGLPVQDPEAGKIYWNDWAGLSDVTTSMQVQRGLSASRVAVPSVGGTINITTKNTETQEGGSISQQFGSYNEYKTIFTYSTGLTPSNWSTTFLLSRTTGDGTAEGLYFTGYNYFANISKILSQNQTLSINFMGASQSHGQRYTYQTINTYRNAPQGVRFNSDWGYLNGQRYSAEINRYNKPLLSIAHDWKISPTSSLSTILYGSYGTGAAVYLTGAQANLNPTGNVPRMADYYSPIDFNAIERSNLGNTDGSTSTYINQAENDHKQGGLVSTFKKKFGDFDFMAGLDMRAYSGNHFYVLNNTLGGQYFVDNTDKNNPGRHVTVGGRINNNYVYDINSEGAFAQLEYVKNSWSAFATVGGTNTSNRKIDYFDYLNSDPNQKSKWVNFLGFQVKGGVNYNIDGNNNVFVNVGQISKAPLIGTVFPSTTSTSVNSAPVLERVFDYEVGYGYRSSLFSLNINAYHTQYNNRAKTVTGLANQDGSIPYGNINGINELHQGIEVDAKVRPVKGLTLSGMVSIGDYHYTSNSGSAIVSSDKPGATPTTVNSYPLNKLPIGDFGGTAASNARTSIYGAVDVDVLPQLRLGANVNYYSRFYASYDLTLLPAAGYQPVTLPDYTIFDLNMAYRFKLAGLNASFIGNVYNLFDTKFITEGIDRSPSVTASYAQQLSALGVNYGAGLLFYTTLKVQF